MDLRQLLRRALGRSDDMQREPSKPIAAQSLPKERTTWATLPAVQGEILGPPAGIRLGPDCLDEFVGQERAMERVAMAMECARIENRALDPVLITGPSGTGKSTLAKLVARSQGSRPVLHRSASCYSVDELHADLRGTAWTRAHRPFLIIDELHSATGKLRDSLLVAMDQLTDPPAGAGVKMTICGLTNRVVSAALRRRFPIQIHLTFSTVEELTHVVESFARQSGVPCQGEAAKLLASVSFTPGRARVFFIEARNRAIALGRPLDAALVLEALGVMGIDAETGLDEIQQAALRFLCDAGRASGNSVRAALGIEDEGVYQELEEVLIRLGYVTVTSRGREPTPRAMSLMDQRETNPL